MRQFSFQGSMLVVLGRVGPKGRFPSTNLVFLIQPVVSPGILRYFSFNLWFLEGFLQHLTSPASSKRRRVSARGSEDPRRRAMSWARAPPAARPASRHRSLRSLVSKFLRLGSRWKGIIVFFYIFSSSVGGFQPLSHNSHNKQTWGNMFPNNRGGGAFL